jgi:glyoxylate/hydroxypyruvate reductase
MQPSRPHVFFSSNVDSPEDWRQALARHLADFTFTAGPQCADARSVDVALLHKLPERGLLEFTNLRAVISLSAGINQFDPKRMPPGVVLSRSIDPTLTRHMVAYAKAAVYHHQRRFDEFERRARAAVWRFEAPKLVSETTVGVLGLGELGGAIAAGLADDGFQVQGWSHSAKPSPRWHAHSGDEGLRAMVGACDIVINVLPLTPSTENILSAALFASFKRGACLVNMGRGAHLVEDDLLAAIEQGIIAGATLDVARREPLPEGHPFWRHPRILVTPHVAGLTSPATAAAQVAENIRRAMHGEALLNQVDFAKGY